MKISNSKKELARIISENGGWRDGAEWAAQDKQYCGSKNNVALYDAKPPRPEKGEECWGGLSGAMLHEFEAAELLPNWHQTVLSRDEYFHLYPAPDADGWVEWGGGECPVDEGDRIDVKFSDGDTLFDVDSNWDWSGGVDMCNIIAYRLHKTEPKIQSEIMGIAQVGDINVVESKPSIEQLATDYRNAKDYADRKQQEADAAKADAEAKLTELVAAGKAIGLVMSVSDAVGVEPEPELVITDWRDLQAGDEVKAVVPNGGVVKSGELGVIITTDKDRIFANFPSQKSYVYFKCHFERGDVKFIRRP